MWQRRAFLKAAGAGFAASLVPRAAEALERADLVFASSVQMVGGGYAAALVDEAGTLITSVALPDRGHDLSFSPTTGQGVVFARQPGTFAVVFDPRGEVAPRTLTCIAGRHFFGHGAFSPDGKLLYATENDFENARGVIGVYDVAGGYARIGEFNTHGIGPHEMLLMPDGETFAVANGGIETHPDFGRAELNIDTMDPSVVFIDRKSGGLIGQLRLEAGLHQLSIRHMALDALGRVWFGCQFRGAADGKPQLVGYATRDGNIRLIDLPETVLGGLRNYVGSVAASAGGEVIGVTSPEGGLAVAVDPVRLEVLSEKPLASVCGMAADRTGLVVTSGKGKLVGFTGSMATDQAFEFGFDNHLTAVG